MTGARGVGAGRVLPALLAAAGALTVLPADVPARAHLGSHEVRVKNNFFEPKILEVDPGETVSWVAEGNNHTVTADDGAFRFPAGGGTVEPGDPPYPWTTPADDVWVLYRCEVHPGMTGAIRVGDPPPVVVPPDPVEVRQVPSEAYPDLRAAVRELPPRARIEIAPGTYALARQVQIAVPPPDNPSIEPIPPEITIVGTGATPEAVVLDGSGATDSAIIATVDGVRIRNLSVAGFGYAGLQFHDADGFVVEDVRIAAPGRFGIRVTGSRQGRIARASVTGARDAAISIEECPGCDTLIDAVTAADGSAGVVVTDAGPVVVMRSTIRDNGVGIVLRAREGTQAGAHIVANHILGNRVAGLEGQDDTPPPLGAGIWVDGGRYDVIEGNVLDDHRWNVLVTGLGGPSIGNRVVDNTVSGASDADLAWDGIGALTCFAGNAGPDGEAPAVEPAWLLALYSCGEHVPVGVPYPAVTARALAGS